MIVILDTNVFWNDAHATRQDLTALFDAVDSRQLAEVEIWTPIGVLEELVRQFGERLERISKVLGEVTNDLSAFRLGRLEVPDHDPAAQSNYREALAARLTAEHRSIADHPSRSGKVVEWAAAHRHPIKPKHPPKPPKSTRDLSAFDKRSTLPVFGVVDAAIWLTVIDAAHHHRSVALVTSNKSDFSDPADATKVHPLLHQDLAAAGINADQVEIWPTVRAFNGRYVAPAEQARNEAIAFLDDEVHSEVLRTEIADAVEWFPWELSDAWNLGVELDYSTLAAFDPHELELVRADPATPGNYLTVWATGTGRFDLSIRKEDADDIPEDSPISVYDWDWNESMVAAEVELPTRLLVEAIVRDGKVSVSIDDVQPA
ncbi:hypothetical protein OJ998_00420 [Solirubrobacter taibaiensis]|nr:hypothetical protein [Solirubrobacter taibaiensis]